jgi:hypothetical protein
LKTVIGENILLLLGTFMFKKYRRGCTPSFASVRDI